MYFQESIPVERSFLCILDLSNSIKVEMGYKPIKIVPYIGAWGAFFITLAILERGGILGITKVVGFSYFSIQQWILPLLPKSVFQR